MEVIQTKIKIILRALFSLKRREILTKRVSLFFGKNQSLTFNCLFPKTLILSIAFLLSTIPGTVLASSSMNISMFVMNKETSKPLEGDQNVVFVIYAGETGNEVWSESQTVNLSYGLLKTSLGAEKNLPEDLDPLNNDYYLGIKIGDDKELAPRKKISPAPFAISSIYSQEAKTLEGKKIGEKEGDILLLGSGGKIDNSFLNVGEDDAQLVLGDDQRLHIQNSDTGTDSTFFNLGAETGLASNNFSLTVSSSSAKPTLRFNASANNWQFSSDGSVFTNFLTQSNISYNSLTEDLLPSLTNTYNLGSTAKRWLNTYTKNLYADNIEASTLTINGSATLGSSGENVTLNSSLIPSVSGLNLGSSSNHWSSLYVDNLVVDTTSTAGTTAQYFTINTDASDNEDSGIRFYRGPTLNTYASFKWDESEEKLNFYSHESSSALGSLNVGNLGIGTTTPQEKLHIITGNSDSVLTGIVLGNQSVTANAGSAIDFRNRSETINTARIIAQRTTTANSNSTLQFWNYYGGSLQEAMRINENGNVGIGITAPTEELHISVPNDESNRVGLLIYHANGGTSSGAGIEFNSAAGRIARILPELSTVPANRGLHFETAASYSAPYVRMMSILGNGNVGIGTTTPNTLLSIYAGASGGVPNPTADLLIEDSTSAYIQLLSPSSQTQGILFGDEVTNNVGGIYYSHDGFSNWGDQMRFRVGGAYRMTLDDSGALMVGATYSGLVGPANGLIVEGNVGIGTTAPASRLHIGVAPTASANYGTLSLGGGYFDGATTGKFAGNANGTSLAVNEVTGFTGNLMDLQWNGVSQFYVNRIGQIMTAGTIYFNAAAGNLSSAGLAVNYNNVAQIFNTNSGASSALSFGTSNTERMKIDPSGNVGIGTTSPLSKLHINGGVGSLATGLSFGDGDTGIYESADDILRFYTGGADRVLIADAYLGSTFGGAILNETSTSINPVLVPSFNDRDTGIGSAEADILSLIAGGVNGLNVNGSGYVGIGTTAPGAKLDVLGDITFSGSLFNGSGYKVISTANNNSVGLGTNRTMMGTGNVAVGYRALYGNATGNNNVAIGSQAGFGMLGSGNIFIGYQAGYSETGSNKLYIENSNSSSPLIYGDFASDILAINGNVGIGTTAPGAKLDVTGSTNITGNLYINGNNAVQGGVAGRAYINFGAAGSGDSYINNGNVGIGTTSPGAALHVVGNITSPGAGAGSEKFGLGATAGGANSFSMGNGAVAGTAGSVAFGKGASAATGTGYNIAMGYYSSANGYRGLSIGWNAQTTSNDSIAIGYNTLVSGHNSMAFGAAASATHDNSVVFGAGTASIATNQFVIGNATTGMGLIVPNGNVGIGTTSPTAKLNVNTGNGTFSFSDYALGYSTSLQIYSGGYLDLSSGAGNPLIISAGAGGYQADLSLKTNSITRLSIMGTGYGTDGNVAIGYTGVGASGPASRLVVKGSDATSANSALNVTDSNDVSKFFVRNDGNVGIGTTTPNVKLQVVGGDIRLDTNEALLFGSSGESYIKGVQSDYLAFGVSDEKVRITTAGNVGIGTTSPTEKLYVSGNSYATGWVQGSTLYAGSIVATSNYIRSGVDLLLQAGGANTYLTVKDTGNVGIGTTAPGTTLDVVGSSIRIKDGTGFASTLTGLRLSMLGGYGYIEVPGADGLNYVVPNIVSAGNPHEFSQGVAGLADTDGEQSFMYLTPIVKQSGTASYNGLKINVTETSLGDGSTGDGNNLLNLAVGGTSKFVVKNSGNVGIGTTSPGAKLEVSGSGVVSGQISSTDNTAQWILSGTGGQIYNATGILYLTNAANNDTVFSNNGSETMRIKNNGNVGIGNVAPGARLHVTGSDDLSTSFAAKIGGATTTGLVIQNNGNVGIGTTAPGAKLDVVGTISTADGTHGYMTMNTDDATDRVGFLEWKLGDGTRLGFMGDGASDITLALENSADFNINGGKVGIGTTSPDTTLKVVGSICASATDTACFGTTAGNIYATNFIVDGTTHLPDYVFEADYPLQSIEELKNYLSKNKHLPGVPSASEVIQTGLNLSQMVPAILEKTEENTLYIISQNDQITSITQNQNKIVEQLTGQLADQNLSVDNKLQLIGQTLNGISADAKDLESLQTQVEKQNQDLIELQKQMADIELQNKAFNEFLLAFDVKNIDNFAKLNAPINIFTGQLEAEGVISGAFSVKVVAGKPKTIGEAFICPLGDESDDCADSSDGQKVSVETDAASDDAKIFVTAENNPSGSVWVEKKADHSGFKIFINPEKPISEKIKINWFIVKKIEE